MSEFRQKTALKDTEMRSQEESVLLQLAKILFQEDFLSSTEKTKLLRFIEKENR